MQSKKLHSKQNKLGYILNFIIIIGIIVFICFIFFKFILPKFISNELPEYNIEDVSFAGVYINDYGKNIFNLKERFEKELLITARTDYQLEIWVKRTNMYFPYIEKTLKDKEMPDDLKYIAVAESYLKNDALSNAGAGGIWQFIPTTAKEYGLLINDFVDERLNTERATNSAIKYLKHLNDKFNGDRFLAMAGYNMGENALDKQIKYQNTNNYFELILNEETYRYVFRILSAKYVYENLYKFGLKINKADYYYLPKHETIEIEYIDDLKSFYTEHNMNLYQFINLNPWIKYNINTLPKREDGDFRDIKVIK